MGGAGGAAVTRLSPWCGCCSPVGQAVGAAAVDAALGEDETAHKAMPPAPSPTTRPPNDGSQPPPTNSPGQQAARKPAGSGQKKPKGPRVSAQKVVRLKVEQAQVEFDESDDDGDATSAVAAAVAAAPRVQHQLPPALVPAPAAAAAQEQAPVSQQQAGRGMPPPARPTTPPQHLGGRSSPAPAMPSERTSPYGYLPAGPPLSTEPSGQLTPAGSVIVNDGANMSQLQAAIRAAAARQSFHRPSTSAFGMPASTTPPVLLSPRRSEELLLAGGPAQLSDTPPDQGMSPPLAGISPPLSRPRSPSPLPAAAPVLPGIAAAAAAAAMAGYGGYSGQGTPPYAATRMPSPHLLSPAASGNLAAMAAAAAGLPQALDPYGYPSHDSSPVRTPGLRAGTRTPPRYYADLLSRPPAAPQYQVQQLPTAWAAPGQPAMQAVQFPSYQSAAPPGVTAMSHMPHASFDSGYGMPGGSQGGGYASARPMSAGRERGRSPAPDARALIGLSGGRPASPALTGGLSVSRAWSSNPASRFVGAAPQGQGQGASGLRGSAYADAPGQSPSAWGAGR